MEGFKGFLKAVQRYKGLIVPLKKSQIMKHFSAVLVSFLLLLSACTSPEESTPPSALYPSNNWVDYSPMEYYGDTIDIENATSLSDLLDQIQSGQDSVYGTFSAKISSVCQVKGCWMQLELGNGEEALVRFKDYGFFVPMNAASEYAYVEGGVKVDTLSVEWLRHQAEDAGASDSVIVAITEPKISYSVLASGVALAQKERAVASEEAEAHDHSSHEH